MFRRIIEDNNSLIINSSISSKCEHANLDSKNALCDGINRECIIKLDVDSVFARIFSGQTV